jgi:hypothetical protein
LSTSIKRLILAFTLGAVALTPATPAVAYTPFQENAVNEYRPLYDPFECDPEANTSDTPVNAKTGTYVAAGNIPLDGKSIQARTYGGGYKQSIGTKYYRQYPGWYPSNPEQGGEQPYDDDGLGSDGKPLAGRTVFSELKNGQALGGLPMGTKIEIDYSGKKIVAVKGDVGPTIGDNAIGLWHETARLLDFKAGSGLMMIHAVSPDTPVTPLTGASSDTANAGSTPSLGNCCLKVDEATGGALTGSDNAEKAFNFFKSKGFTEKQSAGIVGNLQQESGVNPRAKQSPGLGRGIAQWSEGDRWETLKAYAAKTGRDPWTLAVQLDFIMVELRGDYKSAYNAIKAATTIEAAVIAFQDKYEVCGQCEQAARIKFANEALKLYGSGTDPVSGDPGVVDETAAGGCDSSANAGGVVAGSIVKTAVGLAWPDPLGPNSPKAPHSFFTPTPAYKAAMINPSAPDSPQTDCGVFVATVMQKTGADAKYPDRSTGVQTSYVTSHPELYTIIRNPTSTKQLRPGDILLVDGHTSLWVGPQAGGYTVAEASWHNHTPDMHSSGSATWMFNQSNPIIARRR